MRRHRPSPVFILHRCESRYHYTEDWSSVPSQVTFDDNSVSINTFHILTGATVSSLPSPSIFVPRQRSRSFSFHHLNNQIVADSLIHADAYLFCPYIGTCIPDFTSKIEGEFFETLKSETTVLMC